MDSPGDKIHIDNIENVQNLSIINEPNATSGEDQKKFFYEGWFRWVVDCLMKLLRIRQ